jgi:drug/metabolite transporter (DMT)-like permease
MGAKSESGWRELVPLAAIGFLNPGLSYTLSMFGLARTTASAATLLWAFEPILIIALAWFFLREMITPRLVMLALVATLGVLLVSGILGSIEIATGGAVGAALILGGVLCCALYTILSRRTAVGVDPLLTVALQQTAGLLFALTLWPFELQGTARAEVMALSRGELLGAAVSGLMYYAAAFWLYLNGLRSLPASTAGMFINLTPLFGVATAHILLGERLTGMQWLGALMIVGSVAVLLARGRAPELAPAKL